MVQSLKSRQDSNLRSDNSHRSSPKDSSTPQSTSKGSSRGTASTKSSKTSKKTLSPEISKKSEEEIQCEVVIEEEEVVETVENRRRRELIEFLEDLGNSEEFQEFLKEKYRKKDETKPSVVMENEIEEEEREKEKYPLTQKSILERESKNHYENWFISKINRRQQRTQDESIARIRRIIASDKNSFYCHSKERQIEKQKQLETALEEFGQRFQINLDNIYLIKDKINTSFLCFNKIRKFQRRQRKERIIAIIRKLLKEYERQKQIDKAANKTCKYKVKQKKKSVSDVEIIEPGIAYLEEVSEEIIEEEIEEQEKEKIVTEPSVIVVKEKKVKKEKKKAKEAKPKKVKKEKAKKEKIKLKPDDTFKLPQIPNLNLRNKLVSSETHKVADLIMELPLLEKIEKEKSLYQKALMREDRPEVAEDLFTVVTPKELVFQGFKNGVTYKKRITILNSSNYTKKYRLYNIDLQNYLDSKLIQVELFGIQKLAAGISFSTIVTFAPLKLNEYFKTTITFLTYYTDTGEKLQFSIPVTCIPLYSEIIVTPKEVCFDTVPIWVAKKRSKLEKFKIFTIKNCGTRTSFITIKKVRDALEIEEGKEEESITECIENVFNYFEFENYVLEVPPNNQCLLKVYFKNADHVGFYYEKYSINIYEKFDEKNEKFLGYQEISLIAETTGHYITVTPETLDFTFCVFNTIYQLPVCIQNNDKLPHTLALKFPKRLRTNLRASAKNIILQSQQKSVIYLKLIPRKDTIQDNPYYDKTVNLLKVPIYIYVAEKSAVDVPPIKIELFAALYPPLSLTLKPIRTVDRSHLSFVFNMGECSTRETVYGKIAIINESDVVQHYGFLNVPEFITILPNYGFGVIRSCQTIILTILFSPRFEDIPETELIAMKTCYSVNFNIAVETIKNLGGLKEFTDYKGLIKLLKRMEREIDDNIEPPILHEIYALQLVLIKNQYEQTKALQETEIPVQHEEIKDTISVSKLEENEVHSNEKKPSVSSRQTIISSSRKPSIHSTPFSSSVEEKDYYRYFGLPSPTTQQEVHSTEIVEDKINSIEEKNSTSSNSVSSLAQTIPPNKVYIEATIINPLCEFSHQFLSFPTTPCGSYSIMTVELCAMYNPFDLHCDCGYLKKKNPELFLPIDYEADFEIVGSSKEFTIEPTCGVIKSGERKKLTVIAQPEVPTDIIQDQAKAIKIEEIRRKLIEKRLEKKTTSVKKTKQKKKEKKKRKGKVVEEKDKEEEDEKWNSLDEVPVPENLVVLNYVDYHPAEMYVWRSLEPYSIESSFVCTVHYRNQNIDRKKEILQIKATCKVIRPDFITNLKTQHLNFGAVAINSTVKECITIQNIKSETISLIVTILQPNGPFYCPNLKNFILGPEATLNLPINFKPVHEDEVTEYLEIRAGKTIYPLKLSGRGVAVQLHMNPEFLVYRLEAQRGGRTMITLELYNDSEVKLPIKLIKTHELEGSIVKQEKPQVLKEVKAKKGLMSPKKEKKGKKIKHSMELTQDEVYSIKTFFKSRNEESLFYVGDPIIIEPKHKGNIKLRFGVPMTPEELEEEQKGKKKGKKKQTKVLHDEAIVSHEPQKYYVAKYNILLGSQIWRDFIIVANFK